MSNQKNNMILAFALAAAVLFGWQYFIANPAMKAEQARQANLAHVHKAQSTPQHPPSAETPNLPGMVAGSTHLSREAALKAGGPRVVIDTPMLDGSILLEGAKFDDLRLKKYRETTDPKSPEIVLLAPKATDYPYYAAFGWIGSNAKMPDDSSRWKQTGAAALSPGHPVVLTWDNGQGLSFTRTITVDDKYMFTVTDQVANTGGAAVSLYPYAYVARDNVPKTTSSMYLHLGFVGVANGSEVDSNYDDFKEAGTPPKSFSSTGGWLGITDKYWMAAVVPPQNEPYNGEYLGTTLNSDTKAYQANYRLGAREIAPGATATVSHRLFAGAKVVDILRDYQDRLGIVQFDKAVDWGLLSFLTRPFFWLLDNLYKLLGNFGLAILALTVIVKVIFFPLANISYRSMSKMKKVQPEMERVKKANADDPQKQQMAIMELYKREKVNPLAGCLPIALTIPVFIALYKVLYVTIEMRQAPFFGWIHDLSAPDPTSIINLFGLLPFNPHAVLPGFVAFLSIGVWPIIYGATQWVQTKMNPAPPDPMQARMFTLMPIIFTFMFAAFPAGLVIYYTWNNILSVTQQYVIMRREGVKVHLLENLKLKSSTANDG
ncbi:MAG TPA: membrane protein insertase YidC [Rhizomicrobium sp.]|jgi:YidC/Oxa1 family membrane protein insertase|nr:membrane protein insertase YidC [Rhizomicrobium sp.]